jgi:hypothetical protein
VTKDSKKIAVGRRTTEGLIFQNAKSAVCYDSMVLTFDAFNLSIQASDQENRNKEDKKWPDRHKR